MRVARFALGCFVLLLCSGRIFAAAPYLVKDINPNTAAQGSSPGFSVLVGSTLYFSGFVNGLGSELFKSDGTAAGTVLVKDIFPGWASSNPAWLTNVNGTVFFIAGAQLWKTDGTAEGTVLVKDGFQSGGDIFTGGFRAPEQLLNVNGTIFFRAYDSVNGIELWKSDGTTAGTVMLKDIQPGIGGSNPGFFKAVGNTLFFAAF